MAFLGNPLVMRDVIWTSVVGIDQGNEQLRIFDMLDTADTAVAAPAPTTGWQAGANIAPN